MDDRRAIIINASAGSGKTYQLAVAYLRALLLRQDDGRPTPPQNVLATTFTRAAASEILERVLRRLAEAVVSEPARARLRGEIGQPKLGRDDLEKLLVSVCDALPLLQVGTIDALFARIVRVLGLDLAFPAVWTVADETQARELALEAADRLLRGLDVQLAREQWRRFAQFKLGVAVRTILVDLLETNRFLLFDAPVGPDNPHLAEPLRLAMSEATDLIAGLDSFDLPTTRRRLPNQNWRKAIEKIKATLAAEPLLTSLLSGDKLISQLLRDDGTYYSVPVPVGLRALLGPLLTRARADLRRLHQARLPALAALSRRYHDLRRDVAYAGGAYSFPEVEAAVRQLPAHIFAEDLYFRLDGWIQHLLLDEFQDTSLGQFRFLWPIIEEVQGGRRLFFAVGDAKQSIYGWRGADRRLLDRLPGWLANAKVERRNENYRSSPAILRALHRVFDQLGEAQSFDPAQGRDPAHVEVCRRAATAFAHNYGEHIASGANADLPGQVWLHIVAKDDVQGEGAQIEAILRTIRRHRQEDPQREIAVLLRRRKWIPQLIARLRRDGIEASGEGGSAVVDSAAVELVLSMLTWLDHPGHTLAREHVESAGMPEVFGLHAGVDVHHRAHAAILRGGLAAVVGAWVRHEAFEQRCSVHDKVRCAQLVELARRWDATGGGRLAHFVERVRSQRLESPLSSRLRVMTIHGAKGLEFDSVIVGDLPARRASGRAVQLVPSMTAPGAPLQVRLLPSRAYAELLGELELYEEHEQAQFEEDLSVLYVALTRAKCFLDVVITASAHPAATLEGILRERWEHSDAGEYLIESCAGRPTASEAPPAVEPMSADPVIALAARGIDASGFPGVPARLAEVTPSGQESEGRVKLRHLLSPANIEARATGTLVHALLAQITWNDELPSLDEWIEASGSAEMGRDALRQAGKELLPRLARKGDALATVFDRTAALKMWKKEGVTKLELWRERRFAVVSGDDLVSGSFDRVVLGLNAKGQRMRALIYDFKTDRLADAREKEERRNIYQPQLDAYAAALSSLTGLPPGRVSTQLIWLNGPGTRGD